MAADPHQEADFVDFHNAGFITSRGGLGLVGYHVPSEFEPPTGMKYGFLPQLSSLAARIAPNFCRNRAEREKAATMLEMAKKGKNACCEIHQFVEENHNIHPSRCKSSRYILIRKESLIERFLCTRGC